MDTTVCKYILIDWIFTVHFLQQLSALLW